ncbi:hypothetical protein FACS1894164_14680 [Spirochaetia bacterium]|nr:hypothetical protein FACS1894164_14680 [Spirochaetia bacterium]
MELVYTYFPAEEGGFFDECPDCWTDGKNIEELELMLQSLHGDFIQCEKNPDLPISYESTLSIFFRLDFFIVFLTYQYETV